MATTESDLPGTSTPCQKLATAKRLVASSLANWVSKRPRAFSPCTSTGVDTRALTASCTRRMTAVFVNNARVRPSAQVMSSTRWSTICCSAAGSLRSAISGT